MSIFIRYSICAINLTLSGERGVRIAEVEGSIPLPSTKIGNRRSENCGDFSFDHRNTTDGFPV